MDKPSIVIPTLNIDELVNPLIDEIRTHINNVDKISIFNSISSYYKLNRVRHAQQEIGTKYDAVISDCYAKISTPVEGPGMVMGFVQSWSFAKGLSAVMRLQSSWAELSSLVDRKYTYSTAVLSMYVAILSLILSIIFGIFSIPSSVASSAKSASVSDRYPTFNELPIQEHFTGKPAPVDTASSAKARRFRTVLKEGAKVGPNFAGRYTVVKWGCGTACAEFAIVNAIDGRVYFPSTIKFNSYALVHDGTEPFQFRTDSALLIIAGEPDEIDKLGVYYYKWTGNNLKLIYKVERTFEPK